MVTGTAENLTQAAGKGQEGPKAPPALSTGLDKEKGGAETKPERTYRQSEVDALLGKAGQRIQAKLDAITVERDTFKGQLGTLTVEITEAKESLASLTKDIEEMSEGDPDKQGVLRLRKQKEVELKALKAREAKVAETEIKVTKWERDQLVYQVADEFVNASNEPVDFDSFMAAADKFKLSGREGLETLAETMGFKSKSETPTEPVSPPLEPFSGVSSGGSEDLSNLSPREKIDRGIEELKKKKK